MIEEKKSLLTPIQASEILSVHVRTIQRLSKQGKIKGIRIGKLWKYRKEDLNRYYIYGTSN